MYHLKRCIGCTLRLIQDTQKQYRQYRTNAAQRATIPKLSSSACFCVIFAIPTPRAIRKGTVIGPVVTPPESKATAMKLSIEK